MPEAASPAMAMQQAETPQLLNSLCLLFQEPMLYLQAVPLIANDTGTALVLLFQVPLNPTPV